MIVPEFKPFPKLSRLNRECIISEKIDGTNGCIVVTEDGQVFAQSRNRILITDGDSFGFSLWVERNKDRLRETLGIGYHFGEWWGPGIQRGYALSKEHSNTMDKRFSLFNVDRWATLPQSEDLRIVPVLYRGLFTTHAVLDSLNRLSMEGSLASPGFMKPEGVVIFHVAANIGFKVTLEKDYEHKSKNKPTVE